MPDTRLNVHPAMPQAEASDPYVSAWVTANAGSGKTKVLIDRVARLLLGGGGLPPADPSKILCLTYTRAAAATMKNKLFERLGKWALMEDAALARELAALDDPVGETDAPGVAYDLPAARRLFAQALETPGGLKIQTIHAFCESLLRRFPLEAGISPQFRLLDEYETREIMRDARMAVLEDAASGHDPALSQAVEDVLGECFENGFAPLMREVLIHREALEQPDAVFDAALDAELGTAPGETEADAIEAFHAATPPEDIRAIADAFSDKGGTTEKKFVAVAYPALETVDRDQWREALRAAVFKADLIEPRTRFPTQKVITAYPWIGEKIDILRARLTELQARLVAIRTARRTRALRPVARALLATLDASRARKEALDFDGLIQRAAALLTRSDARDWVRYKLDGGVDHILVDEAQDTSPAQWRVITAIADEFFAGEGAATPHRTLFVVGDEKQSIYSFQGADPGALAHVKTRFRERIAGAGQELREPALRHSFRSAPAILKAVDHVFASPEAHKGLSGEGGAPAHLAFRSAARGRIEFWPPVGAEAREEEPPWWHPVDRAGPDAPHLRLADALVSRIAEWLSAPEGSEIIGGGARVRPGDILILVRRRDALAQALIRKLKQRGIPIAGADRMTLETQLAVQDLLALARFTLLPEDDLTLATVLRSPLIGFDDDALAALAVGRKGRLWAALVQRRNENRTFSDAHAMLADMLAQADFLRPFEFFEHALTKHDGRTRLILRLGEEAVDPIDELLAAALSFEADNPPTLELFVSRITAASLQIKREMEQGRDEIRVMTVHGSKGLESRIVIMPDLCAMPKADTPHNLFSSTDGRAVLWAKGKEAPPVVIAERDRRKEAELEEYRRLLYVGLTRAEDWLLACGWYGTKDPKPTSWVSLLRDAFGAVPDDTSAADAAESDAFDDIFENPDFRLADETPLEDTLTLARCETPLRAPDGSTILGYVFSDPPVEVTPARIAEPERAAPEPPPDWLAMRAPREPAPEPPLAPSRALSPDPYMPPPAPEETEGEFTPISDAARGTAVHAFLAQLAPLGVAERSARRDALRDAAAIAACDAALRVLGDTRFEWLFGPGSQAEAPVAGPLCALGGRWIAGSIDRLVIGDTTAHIIDFKTGRAPAPDAIPPAYQAQLALYHAAITEMFPDRHVAAHLLWVDEPRLDTLCATTLARALDDVGSSVHAPARH